jgi:hypothetical protein
MDIPNEVVIETLKRRIQNLQNDLEILKAKFSQLQGFMLDNGYASEYEAWRVGKRIQGEEVC